MNRKPMLTFVLKIAAVGLLTAGFVTLLAGRFADASAHLDAARPPAALSRSDLCPPLAQPTGHTVTVSTEANLRDQAYNAAAGTTILIAAGTYHMQSYVYIVNDGIALRGATGDRDDVVLDFGGMVGGQFGILVEADDVTIADLTIRNANDHGVSIQGRDRPVLYNLHIVDIGDQLVKVNLYGDGSDDGLLACSRLEYTTTAPDEYTNGISAHNAHNWTVRDNEWYRIRTPGNTPVPTILFWSGSSGTVVERNLLVDCYQGISFGNPSHDAGDHSGGVVRNNIIYASQPHDVVIEMIHASGWLVAHNTAWLLSPSPGLTWGMEARFSDSTGTFAYNLTNMPILLDRDGAGATGIGNLTTAQSDWFADAAHADLHLSSTATAAIDQAATLTQVGDDFDGDQRPIGSAPDIGADEYGQPPPEPAGDLRVSRAVTDSTTLTITLTWSPPTGAVTNSLRYSGTRLTASNWASAAPLAAALPGDAGSYTASIPYSGGITYFGHRSQDAAGQWSDVAGTFWPARRLYLPLLARE